MRLEFSFYAMSPIPAMGSIPGQELRSPKACGRAKKRIKKTKNQNQGKKGELNEKDSMEKNSQMTSMVLIHRI